MTAAAEPGAVSRESLGFLLAKASQRWNELLLERLAAAGYPDVRPAYGSLLVPLYEEDGLRQGELARRARLSKQTLTTMARALQRARLVERRPDDRDARATRLWLTERARDQRPAVERVLAELEQQAARSLALPPAELKAALLALAQL
jgi:DNA-binding MarR family transcriptional regulator